MNNTILILIVCMIAGFAYGVVQKAYVKNTIITLSLVVVVCVGVLLYKYPEGGLVRGIADGTLSSLLIAVSAILTLFGLWLAGIGLRWFVTRKPEENHIFKL